MRPGCFALFWFRSISHARLSARCETWLLELFWFRLWERGGGPGIRSSSVDAIHEQSRLARNATTISTSEPRQVLTKPPQHNTSKQDHHLTSNHDHHHHHHHLSSKHNEENPRHCQGARSIPRGTFGLSTPSCSHLPREQEVFHGLPRPLLQAQRVLSTGSHTMGRLRKGNGIDRVRGKAGAGISVGVSQRPPEYPIPSTSS